MGKPMGPKRHKKIAICRLYLDPNSDKKTVLKNPTI